VQAVREAVELCKVLGHESMETEWAIDGEKAARGFNTLFYIMEAYVFVRWERRIGKKIPREEAEPLNLNRLNHGQNGVRPYRGREGNALLGLQPDHRLMHGRPVAHIGNQGFP